MSDKPSIHDLLEELVPSPADDGSSDRNRARKKAMDYLARREHGRRELIGKLTRAGFAADVAEAAVAQLVEDGLQSDERFVENFVVARVNRGTGPARIRSALREHGIEDSLIDRALSESGADWLKLAREVREKKFGPGLPGDFKEKARQMRFLQYRGFEADDIRLAMAVKDD